MKISATVTRSLGILLAVFGGAAACTALADDLSRPITLVATPRLENSEFSKTVLFAAPLPNGMHIGFIVNRPSNVALATAFPEHVPSRKVVDPVYIGGPLLPGGGFAVVRTPPQDAQNLLPPMPGPRLSMGKVAVGRHIQTTPKHRRLF